MSKKEQTKDEHEQPSILDEVPHMVTDDDMILIYAHPGKQLVSIVQDPVLGPALAPVVNTIFGGQDE